MCTFSFYFVMKTKKKGGKFLCIYIWPIGRTCGCEVLLRQENSWMPRRWRRWVFLVFIVSLFFVLLHVCLFTDLYDLGKKILLIDVHLIFFPPVYLIAEDEHDVVWFWLEKGKPHECPVCSQYFVVSGGFNLMPRFITALPDGVGC